MCHYVYNIHSAWFLDGRTSILVTDYLTKWPEVFATKDQTALTTVQLDLNFTDARVFNSTRTPRA